MMTYLSCNQSINLNIIDTNWTDKHLTYKCFTAHDMIRKWYRMGLMDVFDFMIVNRRQEWNMHTTTVEDQCQLDSSQFWWRLAEEMLQCKDESAVNFFHKVQLSSKT